MVAAKKEAEEKKVMQMAKEMETQEKQKAKAVAANGGPAINSQLWTEKYAPQKIKELVGNGSLVAKLQRWLQDWYLRVPSYVDFRPVNVKAGFKKPGKDGMGLYRAVIISGPPGVGKTTTAHLVAKLEGYDILEYNASDTRNEKLLRVNYLQEVADNRKNLQASRIILLFQDFLNMTLDLIRIS
jgi:replication factor C subunit 1